MLRKTETPDLSVKIVFLPFAYTIDQFRWGLFDQSIPVERMNEAWWQLREKYQVCAIALPVGKGGVSRHLSRE